VQSSPQFSESFQKLNPQQKQAVEQIDGPVMVIAGPGTGKTQVLTLRIANILAKTDVQPSNILALTYTEAAAKNMKERLVQLVGPTAYQVVIGTFHSFAERIIQDFPEFFPLQRWSRIASEYEKLRIIRQLLDQAHWVTLRTPGSPYHYTNDILSAISELKREGITPDRYGELLAEEQQQFDAEKSELRATKLTEGERKLAKMAELQEMYRQYQQILKDLQLYDFDDLILMAVEGMKNEATLAAALQEKYQYVLIDEFQDTNTAQFEMALQLTQFWGQDANIFVVGDPHQTIFRFQGASFANIELFLQSFPEATIVQLQTGYRSPPSIYRAAHHLITASGSHHHLPEVLTAFDQPLTSMSDKKNLVEIWSSSNQRCEAIGIAVRIQKLIEGGVQPDEIAVLYKKHSHAELITTELSALHIPFVTMKAPSLWESSFLNQLVTFLTLIHDIPSEPTDDAVLAVLLHPWYALDRLTLLQLSRAAYHRQTSLFELLHHAPAELAKLSNFADQPPLIILSQFESIQKVFNLLLSMASDHVGQPISIWFDDVLRERIGALSWILDQPNRLDLTLQLQAFLQAIKEWNLQAPKLTLTQLLEIITTHQEEGINLTAEPLEPPSAAVTLSTIHSAKGREWAHVFVLHATDGVWGNERSRSKLPLPAGILKLDTDDRKEDANADDRRLFYVALTRAQEQVVLSVPQAVLQNQRTSEKLPSQFIVELQQAPGADEFLSQTQFDAAECGSAQPTPLKPAIAGALWSEAEKNWIDKLLRSFRLSATSLDTYLRSPSEFFWYNLVKLPKIKNDTMAFGTAVHAALEQYYRTFLTQKIWLPSDDVIRTFERSLNRELLSENDRERRRRQGIQVLQTYLAQQPATTAIETEYSVGYGPSQVVVHDMPLTGKIDRIDKAAAPNEVIVVDYKTGSPKTKGEVMGQTQSAEKYMSEREQALPEPLKGRYHRQLLFYKLLLDQEKTHSWKVTHGRLEFVEPTKAGKIAPQEFALSDADVEQLKELIGQVAKEILSLKFLDEVKNHPDDL
jgi:DNA helicase II / ATP-dependent DNA helicase PcrA